MLSIEAYDLLNNIADGDVATKDVLQSFLIREPERGAAVKAMVRALAELVDQELVAWRRLDDFGRPVATHPHEQRVFRELLDAMARAPESWTLSETTVRASQRGVRETFDPRYDAYLPRLRAEFRWSSSTREEPRAS